MNPCIVRSRRPWNVILPIVLAVAAIGVSGGFSAIARAGGASLEFVGNLIQSVQHISLDPLDPTYPHRF
ncbi:MAG: hypothetical protein PW792_10720 [Acidobacteriaceae bacterium]|nr:hypothetical protein [Acidobacteriaceae bacterium]